MSLEEPVLHGTVHGRNIELDRDSGLPDGQSVTVVIKPDFDLPANYEQIVRELSGAWADEGPELDEYLRTCREELPGERPDLEP
jgi:hypothetical protein